MRRSHHTVLTGIKLIACLDYFNVCFDHLVEHINLALSTYGLEEIYGLSGTKRKYTPIKEEKSDSGSLTLHKLIKEAGLVNLSKKIREF